jgi:ABC-type transporter Mla MlaB component
VIGITDLRESRFYTGSIMLKIEAMSDGQNINLILSGELTDEGVHELEQHWRKSRCAGPVRVNVCDVKRIDDSGKALLSRMFCEGVGLVVASHTHS